MSTKHGYIPFARPRGGAYDPVCFEALTTPPGRDYPVVRLDHEEILMHSRVKVVSRLAASFGGWLDEALRV